MDIQAAFKNKQKILKRMKEIQEDESKLPNRKTTLKVKHLMKNISEVAVRKIDNSLTPFYLWVCVMYSNTENDTSILLVFKCLWFMVFNGTFNNISVISWRSVLLVEETRVPGENHRPVVTSLTNFIT